MEVLINTLKEMVSFIKDWGALIIAGISLLVAIISLFKSSKAQRLQNKVNELELKIKQDELDKITKEKEDAELACVEARFITVGKQRCTRGYKRYKETSGLMEWKIGHIFHSIFT